MSRGHAWRQEDVGMSHPELPDERKGERGLAGKEVRVRFGNVPAQHP